MTSGVEILLVEDNPEDAELTLRAFQKYHLANKIHVVRDGEEALECLFGTGRYADSNSQEKPRLILLDLKLPKVDGLEVLQKCKADPRTKTIPVVVLMFPAKSAMWFRVTILASTATSSNRSIFPISPKRSGSSACTGWC